MPHFTLQLMPDGPMVNAVVLVSMARQTALTAAGVPIPNHVQIRALVDTGASATCIDPSVLQSLGLTPTGSTMVNTPTTGSTPVQIDQYDVSILVPGATAAHTPLIFNNIPVICTELLAAQGFHALIGRDILSQCLLTYNGDLGQFTLAY